ncbi:hypothetical protein [Escherichia coli]|uniref:hypothetical protein n=1 Tax=Escherichia coli TaxID=562 RepID=UPI001EFDA019|nr:hypothetical protein [Escherichia coli]
MMKQYDYMKPLSQQLDKVLPDLVKHDEILDKVLPFYLAVAAKLSGKTTQEVFGYNMQALDTIFGTSTEGKSPQERAESEYAFRINMVAREMFDKLPDVE